jgi:hypothetical protein
MSVFICDGIFAPNMTMKVRVRGCIGDRSPLTEDALAKRLHALGITPRQSRSTALFTLAADVPAAILAKTLGIHVKAAIQWQKISGGDWAAYATEVSSRLEH